ncbi:RNA-directed RNA polymerase [ssRNA phage Gerhypos.2_18]|uniref:RNA-directed RNA polymerase n=2 Tax=Norzivirales TaxID=2842247 RepID=A0A8S5KXI5_9VIRU|nr:RNA-directed RNA polymerase [ssRNA phage Gerhypos.2_18]QDH89025.1 MAG: RNA-dependent RNA polymerase [Leviviridae sp.]DAD50438.1 TPA_asm: RNA-directed RNA polymerase [ssRNA phage Gerhypos.2_18]
MTKISSTALYHQLIEDLRPFLTTDQEIAAYLKGDIPLYPDSDPVQWAAVAQLKSLTKKLVDDEAGDADARALEKFRESNRLCERWSWSKESWSMLDDILVGTFKQVVHEVFSHDSVCFDDLSYLSSRGALGSGMNVRSRGNDMYSKLYMAPLSCSKASIFDLYQRYVGSMPRTASAEFIRTLHVGHGPSVCESKVSFAAKSNDISRTICTEPTLNMWYQRAYSDLLEKRLQSAFGIDLAVQPDINRELCRLGSIDGRFATIDLTSASDSLSLKLLRDILPKGCLRILEYFRCTHTILPDGSREELHMVSSMGNGFTFSLQTLIFCCVVEACYRVLDIAISRSVVRGKTWTCGNFSVFGDDIIVVARANNCVSRLLGLLGFRVNVTKSFSIGPFRESCGVDFLNGTNVRPVFIKRLDSEASRFTAINNLRLWSARVNIWIRRTLKYLLRYVRRLYVPRSMPPEVGLHVPSIMVRKIRDDQGIHFAFRALDPVPARYHVKEWEIRGPRFGKRKPFNPDGLLLFALAGGLRDGHFDVRVNEPHVKYRLRLHVTPNWDALPMGLDPLDRAGWDRWSSDSLAVLSQL